MYFFDTSALVKYYHFETGSDCVIRLIDNRKSTIVISDLAKLEFYSAMFRRKRNQKISEKILHEIIKLFDSSLERFIIEPVGQIVIEEAQGLIEKYAENYYLRSLDALQMASFSLVGESGDVFVSADEKLVNTVKKAGYETLNPLDA